MNKEIFKPINSLEGKSFSVKKYQRGYKWTEKEILELLNDVNDHDEDKGRYCLQPIIVKEDSEGIIELIDGQQRITSLYLIHYYLTKKKYYSISYETRQATRELLDEKIEVLDSAITSEVSWVDFITASSEYDNVDIYHIYNVYCHIQKWFSLRESLRESMLDKLINVVNVIWYDISSSSNQKLKLDTEQVFLNLNAGKIPLTSSELIKALFILEAQNKNSKEIAKLKATELSREWDTMETKLHDDLFWFFICDNNRYKQASTRIDFIIDLVNRRPMKNDDGLFSYRKYEEKFKAKTELDWKTIKKTFNKLLEWFDNKEVYHLVGFLIVSEIERLSEILEISEGCSKDVFRDKLKGIIRKEFSKTSKSEDVKVKKYHLENLDYEKYRNECQRVLLLLNISYFMNNNSANKFPFNLYKDHRWSVEHINPQNPRAFLTIGELLEWLSSNKDYYNNSGKLYKEIVRKITEAYAFVSKRESTKLLKEAKFSDEESEALDDLSSRISEDLVLHGISNLALLDLNTNIKISNKTFIEKRKQLLDLDQTGKYQDKKGDLVDVYIPVSTKNVFAKIYTTENQSIASMLFGKKDMTDYMKFMKDELTVYYN